MLQLNYFLLLANRIKVGMFRSCSVHMFKLHFKLFKRKMRQLMPGPFLLEPVDPWAKMLNMMASIKIWFAIYPRFKRLQLEIREWKWDSDWGRTHTGHCEVALECCKLSDIELHIYTQKQKVLTLFHIVIKSSNFILVIITLWSGPIHTPVCLLKFTWY